MVSIIYFLYLLSSKARIHKNIGFKNHNQNQNCSLSLPNFSEVLKNENIRIIANITGQSNDAVRRPFRHTILNRRYSL